MSIFKDLDNDPSQIRRFSPEKTTSGSVMFSVDSDIVSRDDLRKALNSLYPGRLEIKDKAQLIMDEVLEYIYIDGIKMVISEDLSYEMVWIFPDKKGYGEKYIFEIVDYFNHEK